MRTSHDIYKLIDGTLVALDQMTAPPEGATLWNGYNYDKQKWWYQGQEDTRTIEQMKQDTRNLLAPKKERIYLYSGTVEGLASELVPAYQR